MTSKEASKQEECAADTQAVKSVKQKVTETVKEEKQQVTEVVTQVKQQETQGRATCEIRRSMP